VTRYTQELCERATALKETLTWEEVAATLSAEVGWNVRPESLRRVTQPSTLTTKLSKYLQRGRTLKEITDLGYTEDDVRKPPKGLTLFTQRNDFNERFWD